HPAAPARARAGLRPRAVARPGPGGEPARPRRGRRPAGRARAGRRPAPARHDPGCPESGRPGSGCIVKPTRISTLVIIALVCAAAGWLLLRAVYAKLPPLPWTGVPALLIAAVAEAWTGRALKARISGRLQGLKPVAPLFVARMVALAKATSVAAAIIAGFAAGFDFYLAGSLNASTPREDALTAVITFVAAVALACAALYLENCCRGPADPEAPEPDH